MMGVNHLKNWETIPLKIYKLRQQNKSPLRRYRVITWRLLMRSWGSLWGPQVAFLSRSDFQWTKPESEGVTWYDVTFSRPQWTPRLTCCPGLGICFQSSVSLWWFKCDFDVTFIHGMLSCGRRLPSCDSYSRKAVTECHRINSKAEEPRVLSLQKTRKVIRWNTP